MLRAEAPLIDGVGGIEGPMTSTPHDSKVTALLCIDLYDDFLSELVAALRGV
jgi:hypothetical protein